MSTTLFRLRDLPLAPRLALTCLVLVLLGGYAASGLHMREHHQNRDGRAGLTMTDIEGVYHGVTAPARLRGLLESRHPSELDELPAPNGTDVEVLLEWLNGDSLAENWSNIDFGDGYGSPEELTADACGKCHGPQVPADQRPAPLLATWDHYKDLAFDNTVAPTDEAILLASTHAHALALATVTLLLCMLMYGTRLPAGLKGGLTLLASAGLLLDLAAWWLARDSASFVPLIVFGGLAHAGAMGAMMLAVLGDLWAPRGRG
jgi:hypothetical protein